MRILLLLFLIVTAIRPMPVMAAMPDEAHAMMMEGEAEHCEDRQAPDMASHDHCGECCLSVMPPIDFGSAQSVVLALGDPARPVRSALLGRKTTSDPPPPRS